VNTISSLGAWLKNFALLCFLFAVFLPVQAASAVLINEVMSSNVMYLADEDGDYPDWIELHNSGPVAIDLIGYHLSDDIADLQKWQLPVCTIPPAGFLLAFASGKDKSVDQLGEHLESVITWGDEFRYLTLSAPPPSGWRDLEFNDLSWPVGPTGIGNGDGDDATEIPLCQSFLTRRKFNLAGFPTLRHMVLHVDYDDAFVAYLNGVEIARANIGEPFSGPPDWDEIADVSTEAEIYRGGLPVEFMADEFMHLLQSGDNVLTFQVHNIYSGSDLSFIPFLTFGMDSLPPDPRGIADILGPAFPLLHTNFKIDADGETIYLADEFGAFIDSVMVGSIQFDHSHGRLPDGGDDWFTFSTPTAWEANGGEAATDYVVTPTVDRAGGQYPEPILVNVFCDDPLATIRFSTDGGVPATDHQEYTEALLIDSTVVLRIRAFRDGHLPSPTLTNTYLLAEESTFPIVSVCTDPENLWDHDFGIYVEGPDPENPNWDQSWERPIHLEIFELGGTRVISQDAGVKIFGGASRGLPQKSLRLMAKGGYGADRINYRIFTDLEIDEFVQIILRNAGQDFGKTHFRDALMQYMGRDFNVDLQAFRPAILFLNGEYWGIQSFRERLDTDYLSSHYDLGTDEFDFLEHYWTPISGDNLEFIELIEFMKYHPLDNQSDYDWVAQRMDIASFIDYCTMEIFYNNHDWPGGNTKFWQAEDEIPWRWFPFDLDAGLWWYHGWGPDQNTLGRALDYWADSFPLKFLVINPGFRRDLTNAFCDRMSAEFSPQVMHDATDLFQDLFFPEIGRHNERWDHSMAHWYQALTYIHDFIDLRPAYMRDHLRTEFGLSDTFRLALDIDPPGSGHVHLTAIDVTERWQGIYFNGNPVHLKAVPRSDYRFNGWSDPQLPVEFYLSATGDTSLTARFIFQGQIVINEINYNSADDFDPGDWVEFYNSSESAMDISGWHFRDGNVTHDYFFPPETVIPGHGYLVLCEEAAAFHAMFPTVEDYLGGMGFGLSGSGEALALSDGEMTLVDFVHYDDHDPWPHEPDGNGPTLELVDPLGDNSLPELWAASEGHGTPAAMNSTVVGIPQSPSPSPPAYILSPPYPNPFNPSTTLRFSIVTPGPVSLRIYDIAGRLVDSVLDRDLTAGWHETQWRAGKEASGIYFARLTSGGRSLNQKLLLLK
jgi:hypothetical protein